MSYQIRIDALNNKPRKSHKKALKKWQKFLDGEIDINGKPYNKNPQKKKQKNKTGIQKTGLNQQEFQQSE